MIFQNHRRSRRALLRAHRRSGQTAARFSFLQGNTGRVRGRMKPGYLINKSILRGEKEGELARVGRIWQRLRSPSPGAGWDGSCRAARPRTPLGAGRELGDPWAVSAPLGAGGVVNPFHFICAKLLEEPAAAAGSSAGQDGPPSPLLGGCAPRPCGAALPLVPMLILIWVSRSDLAASLVFNFCVNVGGL